MGRKEAAEGVPVGGWGCSTWLHSAVFIFKASSSESHHPGHILLGRCGLLFGPQKIRGRRKLLSTEQEFAKAEGMHAWSSAW